jgi:coatomer subunit beta
MNGDYFLGAVLATALTKLVLHATEAAPPQKANQLRAEAMLMMTSVIRVGQSKFVHIPIDEDAYSRILTCLRVLSNNDKELRVIFAEMCRQVYARMVREQLKKKADQDALANNKSKEEPVDSQIKFRLLQPKGTFNEQAEDVRIALNVIHSNNI